MGNTYDVYIIKHKQLFLHRPEFSEEANVIAGIIEGAFIDVSALRSIKYQNIRHKSFLVTMNMEKYFKENDPAYMYYKHFLLLKSNLIIEDEETPNIPACSVRVTNISTWTRVAAERTRKIMTFNLRDYW